VVVLRELEDLPYRDIAAIVDVPVGTVMSRLARGRQQLARLLMEDEAAPARTKVTPIRASGNAGNAGNTAHKEHHDEL
jgi:RNA polymerase sigma-70 factor (ECF subfamily)